MQGLAYFQGSVSKRAADLTQDLSSHFAHISGQHRVDLKFVPLTH